MTRIPRWLASLAVLVVVVLLAGVGLYVWGVRTPTFGWFAYALLSNDVFVPEPPPRLPRQRAGEVLIALGQLASGFVGGVLVGRRRARP